MRPAPRFLAYCIAQGATSPREMLERDRARYPVDAQLGFDAWLDEQTRAWERETGRRVDSYHGSPQEHREFDAWLADRVITGSPHTTTIQ